MRRICLTFIALFLMLFPAVSFAQAGGDTVTLINPIGATKDNPQGQTNITAFVGKAIKQALGIIGTISFGVFVVGGFMWLTSAGNSDQIKKGTETMVWAGIGVCIIFASYAILGFVITGIGAGNAGPSAPLKGNPISSGTAPPKGTATPAAGGSLCDQYFAKEGLGCFKPTACDTETAPFTVGGSISGTLASNADALQKATKNNPELKSNYISNLCGTGDSVCCKKKVVVTAPPASVVAKKCVFKASIPTLCASRPVTSGFACASPDPKVCELVSGACVPKKVPSECMVLTKESECTGAAMGGYCEWK